MVARVSPSQKHGFTDPEAVQCPSMPSAGLQRDEIEAGDELEVLDVECGHTDGEMQRCRPNDQVLEGDGDALGGLFAFDLPGCAISSETGYTMRSWKTPSAKMRRRCRSASVLAR